MRKSRRITLGKTGVFHKMWRGHNREPVLGTPGDKASYLDHLCRTYKEDIKAHVEWYSYCLMTNHAHESGQAKPDEAGDFDTSIAAFGNWMRNAHSGFGMEYNRKNSRLGKVACERAKTTEIKDEDGILTVMFYGDANPVRAGMVSHPSRYAYSSFNYYAYGKKTDCTDCLTQPAAYRDLGRTPKERQAKYRSLCDRYLRNEGLIQDRPAEGPESPPADLADREAEAARNSDVHNPLRARGDPPGESR